MSCGEKEGCPRTANCAAIYAHPLSCGIHRGASLYTHARMCVCARALRAYSCTQIHLVYEHAHARKYACPACLDGLEEKMTISLRICAIEFSDCVVCMRACMGLHS